MSFTASDAQSLHTLGGLCYTTQGTFVKSSISNYKLRVIMFKKSLLMLSLIVSVSVNAMDPNKKNSFDPYANQPKPTSSFKGNDGNYYYVQGNQTYSSQSYQEKMRKEQAQNYKNNSSYQNDCRIF